MTFASDAKKIRDRFDKVHFFHFRTLRTAKKFGESVEEALGIVVKPARKVKFGKMAGKYLVRVEEV